MNREEAGKHSKLEIILGHWGLVEMGTESRISSFYTMLLVP